MLLPVTVDGVDCLILTAGPDWDDGVDGELLVRTASDAGLSMREGRRALAGATVCSLGWRAALTNAEGNAMRRALRDYSNEPILTPFWPATVLLADLATAKWSGGLRVFFEPDWSEWQVRAGETEPSSFMPSSQCLTAPLMWCRFSELPDPEGESADAMLADLAVIETGAAAYAVAPAGVAMVDGPAVGAVTYRMLPVAPDWGRGIGGGGIELRIERSRLGYGRAEVEDYQAQAARRRGKLTITAHTDEEVALLAELFRESSGPGRAWWAPGGFTETTLAADSSGASTQITVQDAAALDGETFIVLMDPAGRMVGRRVVSVLGNTLTLNAAPGVFTADATVIQPLLLCRFRSDKLKLRWTDYDVGEIVAEVVELPTERAVPEGETLGTSLGQLTPKWWGYVITDGVSTWRLTSYDAPNNAGGLGEFTPAPIDHGDMTMEINLARHDVSLSIGYFEGSPFDRLRTDVHAPSLSVQIYEGTIASPATATLIFTGKVREPKWMGQKCTCKIAGPTALFDVRGPLAVGSPRCWVPLFSELCGLERGDLEAAADLGAINEDGTLTFYETGTTGFPVTPADWFRYGYAERLLSDGTKQRYRIVGHAEVGAGDTIIPALGTLEAETIAWQASMEGAGGTYTTKSLRIANNLVTVLKGKSYYSKIKYLLPLLGGNLAAGLTPLIDPTTKGRPTNANFVDGDFAEATGLQGNGVDKHITLPMTAAQLGSSNNGGIGFWNLDTITRTGASCSQTSGTDSSPEDEAFGFSIASTSNRFRWGKLGNQALQNSTVTAAHFYGQRSSATNRKLFVDGSLVATNTTSDSTSKAGDKPLRAWGTDWHGGASLWWAGRGTVVYTTDGTLSDSDVADLHSTLQEHLLAMKPYIEVGAELIVSVIGSVSPAPSAFPEEGWTLVPGCDKSYTRCKALGGKFRGFPRFPKANPAMVAVKQETSSGGKK